MSATGAPDQRSAPQPQMLTRRVSTTVDGVDLDVAVSERPGEGPVVVLLHGFGGTKEDWADACSDPGLDGCRLIAYDAPGCGRTHCSDLGAVTVPFLVATARSVLAALQVQTFHVVGHSMGGLTALVLADAEPARVLSFTDVEGNLAPEDCFLSRQVISHAHPDPDAFLAEFVERVAHSPEPSSALYASAVAHKVRPGAVRSIFTSMVQLSDHGDLLTRFLALPFPRAFVHGAHNNHLSYLPRLRAAGVEVVEVARSGHWPMYSNPLELWQALATTVGRADRSRR